MASKNQPIDPRPCSASSAARSRIFIVGFLAVYLIGLTTAVRGQKESNDGTVANQLPEAPRALVASGDRDGELAAPEEGPGSSMIAGTVLDTNNDVVQGARVVLSSRSDGEEREMQSGPNGQFSFPGLLSGSYRVKVTGKDMGTFESPWLTVHPKEIKMLSTVVLPVATATSSITVSAESPELRQELSEQQVQIALEQRVLGFIPNFYTSFQWDAPPMEPKQKLQLAFRSMTDPMAFAGAAALAGAEQGNQIFPGYGSGLKGFMRRYGATYANDFDARMLSSGVLATLFHEDPRYFYKGTGSVASRTVYSLSSAVITRTDDGRRRLNCSRLLGVFAGAAISNLYYPDENRGLTLTLANGAVEMAGNAGTNLVREFLLKGITSHPGGKP